MQVSLDKNRLCAGIHDLPKATSSTILLQRGIADPSAKPPPFLGVSSLNLAALAFPKRPFS
jgi:hypothetical protein